MFLTALFIVCGLVYLWQKWNYSFWKRNGVPGPKPSFLVGNMGQVIVQKEHLGILANHWYKKYSNVPYIGYYKILSPAIIVRDVELVKNILIKDFASFFENDLAESSDDPNNLLSVNPFLQRDEHKWKLSRAVMSPMFTTSKMKSIFPLMQTACDKLIKHIERQTTDTDIDSKSLSAKFTTQNIAYCAFSLDINCFEDPNCEFRRMGKKIFQPSFWMGIKFMIIFLMPYLVKIFSVQLLSKEVTQWARKLIRENVESRQNRKLPNDDMVQIMLSIQDKYNLTHDQMAGHALSFFVDGYESSSSVLSFALWQVARHRDIQDKLYGEIVTVLDKYENTLSYEALNEMEYLDLVIQETLRINSIGLTLQKICTKPYVMPKFSGQKKPLVLQPGTPILIPIYAIHHDPEIYPDPETFNPLRFSGEERQNRPKCSFLPFGEGPRMCVGMKFGILQTKLALAHIVRNYKIIESPNCKPFVLDVRSFLYQSRDGLILRFEKRQ